MIDALGISVWQAALGTSLLVAILVSIVRGQFSGLISAIAGINLLGSAYFSSDITKTMALDVICAGILIGRGMRHDVVALIYIAMTPAYLLHVFGVVSIGATYAIVEGLTYLQYAIIGGVGGGLIEHSFHLGRRWCRTLGIMEDGRNTGAGAAMVAREEKIRPRNAPRTD